MFAQRFDPLRKKLRHPITAAAFANDHLTCGALMQAQACGASVPGELAVLGFRDFALGRQMRPAPELRAGRGDASIHRNSPAGTGTRHQDQSHPD